MLILAAFQLSFIETCFLCIPMQSVSVISRLFSSLGLFLWIAVMGLQSFHGWSHHIAHHGSTGDHYTHCDHHHEHVKIVLPDGEAIASDEACELCDWDWLPAGSIGAKALQKSAKQWCQLLKDGAVEPGHCPNHCYRTESHRGPPSNG